MPHQWQPVYVREPRALDGVGLILVWPDGANKWLAVDGDLACKCITIGGACVRIKRPLDGAYTDPPEVTDAFKVVARQACDEFKTRRSGGPTNIEDQLGPLDGNARCDEVAASPSNRETASEVQEESAVDPACEDEVTAAEGLTPSAELDSVGARDPLAQCDGVAASPDTARQVESAVDAACKEKLDSADGLTPSQTEMMLKMIDAAEASAHVASLTAGTPLVSELGEEETTQSASAAALHVRLVEERGETVDAVAPAAATAGDAGKERNVVPVHPIVQATAEPLQVLNEDLSATEIESEDLAATDVEAKDNTVAAAAHVECEAQPFASLSVAEAKGDGEAAHTLMSDSGAAASAPKGCEAEPTRPRDAAEVEEKPDVTIAGASKDSLVTVSVGSEGTAALAVTPDGHTSMGDSHDAGEPAKAVEDKRIPVSDADDCTGENVARDEKARLAQSIVS